MYLFISKYVNVFLFYCKFYTIDIGMSLLIYLNEDSCAIVKDCDNDFYRYEKSL